MALVLKGRAHPAEDSHDPEADAVPYNPFCNDPTPRRPRELVCELLHFQVPLQASAHVVREFILSDKTFVKAVKVLVHHARQGNIADHLATAKHLGLVSAVGDVTSRQLYKWGTEARTPAYISCVAQRRETANRSQQAPEQVIQLMINITSADQATHQTHNRPRNTHLAEASHRRAAHEALLADGCNAREIATAKAAQGKLSDPEHPDAWNGKALADNFNRQGADRSDEALAASVLERYSPIVQDEAVRCQNPANQATHKLAKDPPSVSEQQGDVHVAKRVKTIPGVCTSEQAQPIVSILRITCPSCPTCPSDS